MLSQFAGFIAMAILFLASLVGVQVVRSNSSIGGISVSNLICSEDEVISWVGIGKLDCVHIDVIRAE